MVLKIFMAKERAKESIFDILDHTILWRNATVIKYDKQ